MLSDKTILLTGASEGIGAATARALAERGANVVLAARSAARLEALSEALAGFPGQRLVVPTDLALPAQRESVVARALDQFGRVDVLVNNAAIGVEAPAHETSMAEARLLFEVNFFAPLHLAQLLLPTMQAQGSGQIVQVASIIGLRATPDQALYCASKYALIGLSDAMRVDLHGSGIQVTDIYPGVTATEFVRNQLRTRRTGPRMKIAVPPERVAATIVTAIEQRRRARYVTWRDRLLVAGSRLLPGLAEWALAVGFRQRSARR